MAKTTKTTKPTPTKTEEKPGRAARKTTRATKKATDEVVGTVWTVGPTETPVKDIYAPLAHLSALDLQRGFQPVKVPAREILENATPITFGPTGSPTAGELRAGGRLMLSYDADRSPVKAELGGIPAWGVTAYVAFEPGGQLVEAPAVAFSNAHGEINPQPKSVPIALDIPAGTTAVTVWFKQFQGAEQPRTEWDSNYGQNYHFAVR